MRQKLTKQIDIIISPLHINVIDVVCPCFRRFDCLLILSDNAESLIGFIYVCFTGDWHLCKPEFEQKGK